MKRAINLTQNEVIRNLFVGDDFYNEEDFGFVIDLREWDAERTFIEKDYQYIAGIIYTLSHFMEDRVKVLVHCHGGMDRSPFVVAMYLHEYKDMDPMEAYELVKRRRPQTIIHDDWARAYVNFDPDSEFVHKGENDG